MYSPRDLGDQLSQVSLVLHLPPSTLWAQKTLSALEGQVVPTKKASCDWELVYHHFNFYAWKSKGYTDIYRHCINHVLTGIPLGPLLPEGPDVPWLP